MESWIPTIILPGAFTNTLQDRPASAVKILWMHDGDNPIGFCEQLTETAIGLEVWGKIVQSPQTAHYMALLRDKVVDALSIGFDPVKWTMEERGLDLPPLRKLQEVRLWEVSPVTWGADPLARISDVHRLGRHDSAASRLAALAEAERLAATWRHQPTAVMTHERAEELILQAEINLRRLTPGDTRHTWRSEYADLRRQAAADNRVTPAGILCHDAAQAGRLAPLASHAWLVERAGVQERLAALDEAERKLQHANVQRWVHSR